MQPLHRHASSFFVNLLNVLFYLFIHFLSLLLFPAPAVTREPTERFSSLSHRDDEQGVVFYACQGCCERKYVVLCVTCGVGFDR